MSLTTGKAFCEYFRPLSQLPTSDGRGSEGRRRSGYKKKLLMAIASGKGVTYGIGWGHPFEIKVALYHLNPFPAA